MLPHTSEQQDLEIASLLPKPVIDQAERLVHYPTSTAPGSFGSPLFNTEWQLIGLHHGGSNKTPRLHGDGDYEANEAISLLSIRRRLRKIG